jgi:CheY-like chemotaxis protein
MSRLDPPQPSASADPALIFVVDDNPVLVEFAEAVLQSAGYRVRSFCDPAEALKALRETDTKPALLVTDYDMGTMTGLDLVEFSRLVHPALKTVLLSGTVEASVILKHPVKVNKFLAKPYQPPQLTSLVFELLKQ